MARLGLLPGGSRGEGDPGRLPAGSGHAGPVRCFAEAPRARHPRGRCGRVVRQAAGGAPRLQPGLSADLEACGGAALALRAQQAGAPSIGPKGVLLGGRGGVMPLPGLAPLPGPPGACCGQLSAPEALATCGGGGEIAGRALSSARLKETAGVRLGPAGLRSRSAPQWGRERRAGGGSSKVRSFHPPLRVASRSPPCAEPREAPLWLGIFLLQQQQQQQLGWGEVGESCPGTAVAPQRAGPPGGCLLEVTCDSPQAGGKLQHCPPATGQGLVSIL